MNRSKSRSIINANNTETLPGLDAKSLQNMTSNFDRTLRHYLRDVIKTGFVVERPIYIALSISEADC